MNGGPAGVDHFMALADQLTGADPRLTPMQAGILAAAHLGISRDSRSFSRLFGLAHALVLRELTGLVELGDMIAVTRRDTPSMRTHYAMGSQGRNLLATWQDAHAA